MLQESAPRGTGLAERAYAHVKTQMMDGRYPEGDWIPVEVIADELGISRQPVMDAIKRLSSEGFIEIVPQVGSRVRKYSEGEIRDFYQLFASSEALTAELAAQRATPSDITHLRLISQQISELFRLSAEDKERGRLYRVLNRRLHAEIRRVMRSPSLAEIVESLGDRSDFYIAGAPRPVFSPGLIDAHAEHERVIDAIASGDERLARATMEAHIRATERRLMQRLIGDGKETQETSATAQVSAPPSRGPSPEPTTKRRSGRRGAR